MSINGTFESKNLGANRTWNAATETWDDADTWDEQIGLFGTKESKNTSINGSLEAKN